MTLCLAVLAVILTPGSVAANNPSSGPTFAQLVFASPVVAVAKVLSAAPNGSATIAYERVYKGHVPPTVQFPPDDKAEPLTTGEHVLMLQGLDTLDFRATYALEIGADGSIDVRDIPGAPRTLAALDAYFNLPETDAPAFGRGNQPVGGPAGLILLGAAFLGLAVILRRSAVPRTPAH